MTRFTIQIQVPPPPFTTFLALCEILKYIHSCHFCWSVVSFFLQHFGQIIWADAASEVYKLSCPNWGAKVYILQSIEILKDIHFCFCLHIIVVQNFNETVGVDSQNNVLLHPVRYTGHFSENKNLCVQFIHLYNVTNA